MFFEPSLKSLEDSSVYYLSSFTLPQLTHISAHLFGNGIYVFGSHQKAFDVLTSIKVPWGI